MTARKPRAAVQAAARAITGEGWSGDSKPHTITGPRSYRPMVYLPAERKWSGNGLRFATREEAETQAADLLCRWTVPSDSRADPSDDAPNYRYVDGKLEALAPAE